MWVRRPQGMNLLFVSPEAIWIEEGLWAGRTGKPNTKMSLVFMGANGHMRVGQSLTAPLNLALVDPLDVPPHSDEGVSCQWGWQPLRPEGCPRREPPVPACPPQLWEWKILGQPFQAPEGARWQWGSINASWQDVGPLMQINGTGHPARAHTGLLPQTWPLPTPPFGGLQSLGTEPPYTKGWPDVASVGPEKGDRSVTKVRLSHKTAKE